jgi:membrane protein DedA with SNARE-associated domain
MDVTKLLELIQTHQQWVYGLLLAYTLAKTGPLPLVAGYVSGTGALEFGLVIAACSVGTIAGSNIRFFVGSLLSSRLFRWSPKAAPWIALGAVGVDRFGFWLLPLYRFSKGTFTLVGLGAGISYPSGKVILTASTRPALHLRWLVTSDAAATRRYGWPDALASARARP